MAASRTGTPVADASVVDYEAPLPWNCTLNHMAKRSATFSQVGFMERLHTLAFTVGFRLALGTADRLPFLEI